MSDTASCILQLDDPLDALAVHAWNGAWGVLAVGFLSAEGLIQASYGFASTSPDCVSDPSDPNHCPFRQYGCWLGGDGTLLGAQVIYMLWLAGALRACCMWLLARCERNVM